MTKPMTVYFPVESKLLAEKDRYDWFDAYRIELADDSSTSWTVCEAMLDVTPRWALLLFGLRNAVVRLFGLPSASMSTESAREFLRSLESKAAADFPVEAGVAGGKVFFASPEEIVAGADDWHLDFRASVLTGHRRVTITTVVRFKHWFGRLYFLPVKPFHQLIVRSLLRRAARYAAKTRAKLRDEH